MAVREVLYTPPKESYKIDGIQIIVYETIPGTARAAASDILKTPTYNPEAAITFATGQTMEPVSEHLAELAQRHQISFARTRLYHLDERYPSSPQNPNGFVFFLKNRFQNPLGIPDSQAFYMNGLADDPREEANRYNLLLARQPINLAIVGFGPLPEVHLGFNLAGTPFTTRTHYVPRLSDATLQRDLVERGEQVPEGAITQGPANIFEATKIIGVAYGVPKGNALVKVLFSDIDTSCVASGLRLPYVAHKVTIYVDHAASSVIKAAHQSFA